MRCPECDFIVADSRDICPRCFFDLREFKLGHDIPVSNPQAYYSELYEELTGKKFIAPEELEAQTHALSPEEIALKVIDGLFDEAFKALASEAPSEDLGLAHEQFVKIDKSEEIDLLFELCDESLLNPELDSKYSEKVFVSGDKVLESQLLKAELAKVERSLDAPLPTLKELQQRAKKFGLKGWSVPKAPEFPAISRELAARLLAIDWGVVLGLSLLLSLYYRGALLLSFVTSLLDVGLVTNYVGLAEFFAFLVPCLLCVASAYWTFCLTFFGRTVGMAPVGVKVLTERGKPISFANAFVRTSLAPWSFPFSGDSSPKAGEKTGKRNFSDRMARTVLVEEKVALKVLAEASRGA